MNEMFSNLEQAPNDWVRVELGTICDVSGGFAAPKVTDAFQNGNVPFVRMQDLGRFHRTTNLINTRDKLNSNYVQKHRLRIVKKGSILIPRSGSVSLNHRAILGTDACIVSHICALTLRVADIDILYLYYALCNVDMRRIMRKTTGLDAITFEDVKHVRIPFPPISVQKEIGRILQRTERLKETRKEAKQLTSKVIQSVFLKMFGDPAQNPFEYPVFSLGSLATMSRYGPRFYNQPYSEVGIPILRTTDITEDGELSLDKAPKLKVSADDLQKYRLRSGDVVISRSGSLGRCAVYDMADVDCIPGAFLLHFRFGDKVLPEYVQHFILSESIQKRIQGMGKVVAQPNVNMKELSKLKVPVPPIQNQRRFVEAKSKYRQLRQRQNESFEEISELLQSLMYSAFRGELRIGTNDRMDIRISKPVNVETEVQSTLANYISDS